MGNVKISELPGTTTLSDADAIPVVQGGVTKKFTGALTALKSLLGIDALNGKTETSFDLDPSSGLISRGTQTVRKTSHMLSVSMAFSLPRSINVPVAVATLPAGFRPGRNIAKFVSLGGVSAFLNIDTSGVIKLGYTSGDPSEDAYIHVDETMMV